MEIKFHKEAAAGKWFHLSFDEQLGNIGSEVARVAHWKEEGGNHFANAVQRALELFALTFSGVRWYNKRLCGSVNSPLFWQSLPLS